MRTAVFDLDGTLADTSRDLIGAANACFDTPPLDPEADAGTAFRGGRAMLSLGLQRQGVAETADIEALHCRFLDHYAARIDAETRIYDGVEAALDTLAAQGWRLAVCTNKPAALAETLLQRLGLRTRFLAMLGADSLAVKKPDPAHVLETVARAGGDPTRAVMIGDTQTDRDAARAAGIPCVLMGFGPGAATAADLAPEAILPHYDDLPGLLDQLVGG
ncbi:MAG: HAD-IA family hydrolase [Pseudomonadota bacterium]